MAISAPSRTRLARFTVASAIATGISQVVLLIVYGTTTMDATTASTIAFLAGSAPHFLMVRYWTWEDTSPGRLRAQLTTYLTVTFIGGVASIALTTLAEDLVLPLLPDGGWQTVALTLSYLAASGPVFLAKFAVFDRAFARRAQRGYRVPSGRSSVNAASADKPSVNSAAVAASVRVPMAFTGS